MNYTLSDLCIHVIFIVLNQFFGGSGSIISRVGG